jgi:hypothetical protein
MIGLKEPKSWRSPRLAMRALLAFGNRAYARRFTTQSS